MYSSSRRSRKKLQNDALVVKIGICTGKHGPVLNWSPLDSLRIHFGFTLNSLWIHSGFSLDSIWFILVFLGAPLPDLALLPRRPRLQRRAAERGDPGEDGQAGPRDGCPTRCGRLRCLSLGCSFSAGSTPIFASKHKIFSIYQDLQGNHLLASKFAKILQNLSEFCTNV